MGPLKNLADVSKAEQIKFILSFDDVVFDINGATWSTLKTLPKAPECIEHLRNKGKNVRFLTDTADVTSDVILEYLKDNSVSADVHDLFYPIIGIISYFQKINFTKEIFVIGSTAMKYELVKAGFKLAKEAPELVEESFKGVLVHNEGNENVGAVLIDYDLNVRYMKLQKAIWCLLQQYDCELIIGNAAEKLEVDMRGPVFGMSHFIKTLTDISGKEGIHVGKHSQYYVDVLKKTFNITCPKRTLFIDDKIELDINTNVQDGFQKLLVLSNTNEAHTRNCQHLEESNVEYYVENLESFNKIIRSVC